MKSIILFCAITIFFTSFAFGQNELWDRNEKNKYNLKSSRNQDSNADKIINSDGSLLSIPISNDNLQPAEILNIPEKNRLILNISSKSEYGISISYVIIDSKDWIKKRFLNYSKKFVEDFNETETTSLKQSYANNNIVYIAIKDEKNTVPYYLKYSLDIDYNSNNKIPKIKCSNSPKGCNSSIKDLNYSELLESNKFVFINKEVTLSLEKNSVGTEKIYKFRRPISEEDFTFNKSLAINNYTEYIENYPNGKYLGIIRNAENINRTSQKSYQNLENTAMEFQRKIDKKNDLEAKKQMVELAALGVAVGGVVLAAGVGLNIKNVSEINFENRNQSNYKSDTYDFYSSSNTKNNQSLDSKEKYKSEINYNKSLAPNAREINETSSFNCFKSSTECNAFYVKFNPDVDDKIITGTLFYSLKKGRFFMDAGGGFNHYYLTKDAALNAVYIWNKYGKVSKYQEQ